MRLIERIWTGASLSDRIARAALVPFEALYRGGVALRGELYDRGVIAVERAAIPVVSVGNLTVGGTGKTPVSAWIADRLGRRGFTPAIVLRGYGLDEPMVHRRLNPGINIIVASDRVAATRQALETGSDIVVLDDAFQHRRAARDLDIVLVSADAWSENQHLLPAGPYREPLSSLRRASAIVITRKAASDERVADAASAVRKHASGTAVAVVLLSLAEIVRESEPESRLPISALAGKSVLAIAGVGNPVAFFSQLAEAGARVTPREFPDHHAFGADDAARILGSGEQFDYVVCTLKDAVKLGPLWPAGAPALWYVSLAVRFESGEAELEELLMRPRGRIDVA